MKTDNVLVSREKWEAMEDALGRSWDSIDAYQEILAMPDFVDSDGDVEVVAKEIHKSTPAFKTIYDGFYNYSIPVSFEETKKERTTQAQAAFNALKIKGE